MMISYSILIFLLAVWGHYYSLPKAPPPQPFTDLVWGPPARTIGFVIHVAKRWYVLGRA